MGKPAIRYEQPEFEPAAGTIVQLKPPPGSHRGAPIPVPPPTGETAAALGMVARAASLLISHKERAETLEKRCHSVEEQLKVANRRLADAEIRLSAAQEDAKTERCRAGEMQRRSTQVIERTRTMLNEAAERLRDAESRAARAEASYASIRNAVEAQLAPHTAS